VKKSAPSALRRQLSANHPQILRRRLSAELFPASEGRAAFDFCTPDLKVGPTEDLWDALLISARTDLKVGPTDGLWDAL
jgi:hypothetical protein